MRRSLAAVVGALLILLLALPVSGARFTDTTTNAGSTFAFGAPQPIRSTTYRFSCEAATCSIRLNQPLAEDYFVLLRGSNGGTDAAEDYLRVSADPFETGGLGYSGAADRLTVARWRVDAEDPWWGEATVIESLAQQATAGFYLVDVIVETMAVGDRNASVAPATPWESESQIGLYGGSLGGGMTVRPVDDSPIGHESGWARIWPEDGRVNLYRSHSESTGKFTIYAVEWGSEWTIQHVRVAGDRGGPGVDHTKEYSSTKLATNVVPAQTFVLAYGTTEETSAAAGWEGQIFTIGNGNSPPTGTGNGKKEAGNANKVSIGAEQQGYRDAEVYVHTHPQLRVDWRFGGMSEGQEFGTQAVDAPTVPDQYHSNSSTDRLRFPIFSNSYRESSADDPQSIAWARHTAGATVSWARDDSAGAGAYWLQSVDFGEIWR